MTRKPDPSRQPSKKRPTKRASKSQNTPEMASSASVSTRTYDDADHLERAAALWLHGDWENLIQINLDSVRHSAAKARLALLLASAHIQTGNPTAARKFVRLAFELGCDRNQVARILVSGVYNTIARAAALANQADNGLQHFENAIAVGLPGADVRLLAGTRSRHQLSELGLQPGGEGRLQRARGIAALGKIGASPVRPATPAVTAINTDTLSFYQNLRSLSDKTPLPFLLIDSKSMPRSGLHYLKNTLARLLGEHFSFCEWYREVGCCKQRPCALTGYATHAQQTGKCRIRLIKSHDFEHNDPYVETSPHLQRLILIRDPLFTLTSWFELEQLGKYTKNLAQHGIDMPKIWLAHEKEVLESAYRVLDGCFEPPGIDNLASWLLNKSGYITSFLDRWVRPALQKPDPYTHLVAYNRIDQFIVQLTDPYRSAISKSACKAIDEFAASKNSNFNKRTNPFAAKTASVATYLDKYSYMFLEAANHLKSHYPSEIPGLLES